MRVAVLGTVAFTATCIRALVAGGDVPVGVLGRRRSPGNSDFVDVVALARELGAPALYVDRLRTPEETAALARLRADVLLAVGWPFLVPREARAAVGIAIGSHPAPLPVGRGRHPIVWAILLGLRETALTFFELADDPDAGDILWQRSIPIGERDDAGTLYRAVEEAAASDLPRLLDALRSGRAEPRPQDHARAMVWRKRTEEDGRIDWRMSSDAVARLVRALTRPYVGAHLDLDGTRVRVWRAAVTGLEPAWRASEPGRVLAVSRRDVTVRTGDGAVILTEHDLERMPAVGATLAAEMR